MRRSRKAVLSNKLTAAWTDSQKHPANGASILVNFTLGVQKTGQFRVYIIVEALP